MIFEMAEPSGNQNRLTLGYIKGDLISSQLTWPDGTTKPIANGAAAFQFSTAHTTVIDMKLFCIDKWATFSTINADDA